MQCALERTNFGWGTVRARMPLKTVDVLRNVIACMYVTSPITLYAEMLSVRSKTYVDHAHLHTVVRQLRLFGVTLTAPGMHAKTCGVLSTFTVFELP
jgi:hypothetical protein